MTWYFLLRAHQMDKGTPPVELSVNVYDERTTQLFVTDDNGQPVLDAAGQRQLNPDPGPPLFIVSARGEVTDDAGTWIMRLSALANDEIEKLDALHTAGPRLSEYEGKAVPVLPRGTAPPAGLAHVADYIDWFERTGGEPVPAPPRPPGPRGRAEPQVQTFYPEGYDPVKGAWTDAS